MYLASDTAVLGVTVEVCLDSQLNITVSVLIKYGSYAPRFLRMLNTIVEKITGMTGLEVSGVNELKMFS